MKNSLIILMLSLLFVSCKSNEKEGENKELVKEEIAYASFGDKIDDVDALTTKKMTDTYKNMSVGDTINTKMMATVKKVCQAKGCWMTVNLENGETATVKFKDYGFFMPKNISGKDVVVNGKAYVSEVSVDEQRHYAEDGGKSKEEIAAITEPKKTYTFLADGVLVKED